MPRGSDDIDDSASQIKRSYTLRPLCESEEAFYRGEIGLYQPNSWTGMKQRVAGTVVEMFVGVHHKKRKSLTPLPWQEVEHSIQKRRRLGAFEGASVD